MIISDQEFKLCASSIESKTHLVGHNREFEIWGIFWGAIFIIDRV